jgi:hypothetical protein
MREHREQCDRQTVATEPHLGDLLDALVHAWCLAGIVPLVLEAAERDPLASGGRFAGDLVRGLMEVPSTFWCRYPGLYGRYQAVLRANALARQRLPVEQRLEFWTALGEVRAEAARGVEREGA